MPRLQDITADWSDETMHDGWMSTRDFESTNETFYFGAKHAMADDDEGADDDLALAPVGDAAAWREALTPSQRWLADAQGVKIPATCVSTEEEKQLFKDNYRRFFVQKSSSQNSYDAHDYDAFAVWWNNKVDELEKVILIPLLIAPQPDPSYDYQ